MKIGINDNHQIYCIVLIDRKNADFGAQFEIKSEGPESEQILEVPVLAQTRDSSTLEIDGKIRDVLISETQK